MSIIRYAVAAGVSFSLHATVLFGGDEPQAITMPVGQSSPSVALNFVALNSVALNTAAIPAPQVASATPAPIAPPIETPVKTPKVETKSVPKKPSLNKQATAKAEVKPKNIPAQKPINTAKVAESKPVEQASQAKVYQTEAYQTNNSQKKSSQTKSSQTKASQGANAKPLMVAKPSFLKQPITPSYPSSARKRGQEGVVTYEVWLDEKGRQVKQVLIHSSGVSSLDRSALNAIKKWQFSPYTVNNQGVAHRVQIPVNFKLDS